MISEPEKRFGRYEILAPLAEGGMAKVHLARRENAEEICVLKRLKIDLVDNQVTSARFEREANLIAQLSHENIAAVLDAGREGATFYIAFEFIAGKDVESVMHHLMKNGFMMPYQASIHIALKTLKALSYAHEATDVSGNIIDLVHRDLSPRNIMVSYNGEIKVIDFGLARGKIDDFKTAPGMLMGTLRYISPEQALALPVDGRSDLYTLSVVLWELLAGRLLVEEKQTAEILKAVVHSPAPRLDEINPAITKSLADVIEKGLDKKAENRFGTAGEYFESLYSAAADVTSLKPGELGEFLQQIFPADFNNAKKFHSPNDIDWTDESLKTVAQDTILPTRTAFRIPTRPKPAETKAKARPAKTSRFLDSPAIWVRSFGGQRVLTWLFCFAILGSTSFIGIRFIDTMLASQNAETHPHKSSYEQPTTDGFRAIPKEDKNAPVPSLKAPQITKVTGTQITKAKSSSKKTRKAREKKAKPQNTRELTLRERIVVAGQSPYNQESWKNILREIESKASALPDSRQANRISRLARKAITYQKVEYFLKAVKGLEK
ncbi:MAG: serine/threonine-protein kinase [Myxococcota bacterium]|nr:serine/threonine-protein kinase [Myxococcota bacterium]